VQLIRRAMSHLLDAISTSCRHIDSVDFDGFRRELLDGYRADFFDFNYDNFRFTVPQDEKILRSPSYVITTPIRLIALVLTRRNALSCARSDCPLHRGIPEAATGVPQGRRNKTRRYAMIATSERRYTKLENRGQKVTAAS
jgi:hypothetical protein